jgi:predicted Zn finger-like uncharacterized protein
MPVESNCPGCGTKVRVPESLLGKSVKCPKCQSVFTAESPEPGFEEVVEDEPRPRRPRRPAPVDDYDDDQGDDYEARPRPRRGGRRRAADAVRGPAIALMVVGGLGFALALLNFVMILAGKGQVFDVRNQGPGMAANDMRGVQIAASILPLSWGIIVPLGAFKLMNLQSYGLAMTGVIFAMLPCNGCCILGLPFGIWALVAMNRPEVKAAFD